MTRADHELEEFGRKTFDALRPSPPLNEQAASELKAKFLFEGENLRQASIKEPGGEVTRPSRRKRGLFEAFQRKPAMKALVAVLLAFVVLLASSSLTVFASQSSLPGQPLYPVKSWSEDVQLSVTYSPDAKLRLTLNYTNRRMEEISSLLAGGNTISDQTANRFQNELEDALQLAAQLNDTQIQQALGEIKNHAEKQGLLIQELIVKLPPQADPAVQRLQERLNEQVQLSNIGEKNPKEFRVQVRERLQRVHGPKHSPDTGQSQTTTDETVITPLPSQESHNHGIEMSQPTDSPDNSGSGNGQGQTTPGNGNHGLNPTHTPKP